MCQCSVLVLLHLYLWGETPLLLPSLPAHLLRPAPTDTLLLREKTLVAYYYSGKTNPSPGPPGNGWQQRCDGRQLKEESDSDHINRGDTSAFR